MLAKKATERACDPSISVTRTNALRQTKVIATKLWHCEWRKSALTGYFAIANRLPPSLNTTHHFYAQKNNQELFGRTLQCRTGHGHTGEFRQRFSLDGQYDFLQVSGAFSRPGAGITAPPPTYDDEPIPPLDDDSRSDPGN